MNQYEKYLHAIKSIHQNYNGDVILVRKWIKNMSLCLREDVRTKQPSAKFRYKMFRMAVHEFLGIKRVQVAAQQDREEVLFHGH